MESSTKEFIESILDGKFTAKKTTQSIGFVRTTTEKKEEAQIKLPPMVVDADGLKLLAQIKDWHQETSCFFDFDSSSRRDGCAD